MVQEFLEGCVAKGRWLEGAFSWTRICLSLISSRANSFHRLADLALMRSDHGAPPAG